ncbi:MAG: hypothetical protein ACREU2_17745 [Steroidobacteraceae bacterium]
MRLVSLAALALSAALSAGVPAATTVTADPAAGLQVLQDCLANVPAVVPAPALAPPRAPAAVGAARAAASAPDDFILRCPQIVPAISRLGLGDQLGAHWQRDLTRGELQGLVRLVQRYRAGPPSAAPALAALPGVLRRLREPPTAHSWWQDFKARLRRLLMQQGAAGSDWLARLLPMLPQTVLRAILYGTAASVVALAVWIILRELKALGSPFRGRQRRGGAAALLASDRAAAARLLSLRDVEAAPMTERSIVLVRLLVQALRQAGKLVGDHTLTYRELGEHGSFDTLEQRGRFVRLALLAERDRYGMGAMAAEQWQTVSSEGRALHAEILAAAPGTGSAD